MDDERYREGENLYDNKDEDYGLPKVSYDPVNREEAREPIIMNPKDRPGNKKNTDKNESSWPIVVGIIVIIAIAGVLVYLFLIRTPEAPPIIQEPTPPPVVEEIPEAEEFETVVDTEWEVPAEPVTPSVGSISTINARTGQAYVIAGSFIDVDLARDYGNKLAGEGVSTTIIEPYGQVKYYRLSVASYATVAEALENVEQLKVNYGDNIWVLKY